MNPEVSVEDKSPSLATYALLEKGHKRSAEALQWGFIRCLRQAPSNSERLMRSASQILRLSTRIYMVPVIILSMACIQCPQDNRASPD